MYHRLDLPVRWKQQWFRFFIPEVSSSRNYNRIVCRKQCIQSMQIHALPYTSYHSTYRMHTAKWIIYISSVESKAYFSRKISNTRSTLSHNNRTKFNPCLFNYRIVMCNTKYNALSYVRLPITKKVRLFYYKGKMDYLHHLDISKIQKPY